MTKRTSILRIHALIAMGAIFSPAASKAATSTVTFAPIAFGNVPSLYQDLTNIQSVCAFGSLLTQGYSVLANGSGAGGAFTVTNGTSTIPYEFQWAQTGGATSGAAVVPNSPLTNQYEASLLQGVGCLLGAKSATSIVIVRASSLQQATAGTYTGTLTIILSTQ